jgi:hypothetical protein
VAGQTEPKGVPDLERVEIDDAAALWEWLESNHDSPVAVLLVTYKNVVPDRYVSRDEVLDALVAYGWTDGRRFALDGDRTMQRSNVEAQWPGGTPAHRRIGERLALGRIGQAARHARSADRSDRRPRHTG